MFGNLIYILKKFTIIIVYSYRLTKKFIFILPHRLTDRE